MINKLDISPHYEILEPCAGDGAFIDALIAKDPNLLIDAYEINPRAINLLKQKYIDKHNIQIILGDTIIDDAILIVEKQKKYDRIISNPPFGGWQDYERRKKLKKLFPELYVKETYALFLYKCVNLLKNNGKLVFILPDTYLNLHMHTKLREFLLTCTKIEEIALFPSSFFPGICFGYSNLSIITLKKTSSKKEALSNKFSVINGFDSVRSLEDINNNKHKTYYFCQQSAYENLQHAIFVTENNRITELLNTSKVRVGDIAECVTGFYSGNDKNYLKIGSASHRKASIYKLIDINLIYDGELNNSNLNGIDGLKSFVPLVKGGGIKYLKPDLWYMDWSINAVKNYKTDKKARFQNSQFYFKRGIAVPMVSSSRITATLMENKLFDQSIVGMFPKNQKWTFYLLAFFNSPVCNKLIRIINPTANASAKYIRKIPFIEPSEQTLRVINELMQNILADLKLKGRYDEESEIQIHKIIEELYGFSI